MWYSTRAGAECQHGLPEGRTSRWFLSSGVESPFVPQEKRQPIGPGTYLVFPQHLRGLASTADSPCDHLQ